MTPSNAASAEVLARCVTEFKNRIIVKVEKHYGDNMYDKQLLQKKILLQKTKNLMAKIDGIKILGYEEQNIFDDRMLRSIGFYNGEKTPDAAIAYSSDEESIVNWIIDNLGFEADESCCLWVQGFLVRIRILDIRAAVESLWNELNPNSKGFVLSTHDYKTMLEFGSDSRDEYSVLFDKYILSE